MTALRLGASLLDLSTASEAQPPLGLSEEGNVLPSCVWGVEHRAKLSKKGGREALYQRGWRFRGVEEDWL